MKVRRYRAAGVAHSGNRLALRHGLSLLYLYFVKVRIAGHQTPAMIDLDVRAVPGLQAAFRVERNASGCGSNDHRSARRGEVDTGMLGFPLVQWIESGSKAGHDEV